MITKEEAQKKVKAILAGPKKASTKVLFEYRDYELVLRHGKRQVLPRILLREKPEKPISVKSIGATVMGEPMGWRTFPFTTTNAGLLELGFGAVKGRLGISMEDPPASLDFEDGKAKLEVSYGQPVPGIGDLSARVRSNGEWFASFDREVEDIGHLSAVLDSQLDWVLDLETDYKGYKGIVPTVTYGATQDGMRVRAKFAGALGSYEGASADGSYVVENLPGKYAPADFLHDCKVVLASEGGRQSLAAHAIYDRRLPKFPVRGSLSATANVGRGALEASADFDRYRLQCRVADAQVSAAIARKAAEKGLQRPGEVELKYGKVSATAALVEDGPPRLKLSFGR